jgi:multiple sugar transport system ATP-binding protein
MDEPLGTLDTEFRDAMVRELRQLHNRIGATTVYVTHDQLEAMAMADKIAIMNHGVIEQLGTPSEVYNHPASLFVADFVGSPPMNFIRFNAGLQKGASKVRLNGAEVAIPTIREDISPADLVLGVRPEHIRFDDNSALRGAVYESEYLGTTQIVAIEVKGAIVKARVPSDRSFKVGENLGLTFEAPRLSLFDSASGRAIRTSAQEEAAHG